MWTLHGRQLRIDKGGDQLYIDPGAGSLFFQVLIGALIAGPVALKLFWGKIRPHRKSQIDDETDSTDY